MEATERGIKYRDIYCHLPVILCYNSSRDFNWVLVVGNDSPAWVPVSFEYPSGVSNTLT